MTVLEIVHPSPVAPCVTEVGSESLAWPAPQSPEPHQAPAIANQSAAYTQCPGLTWLYMLCENEKVKFFHWI